MFRTFSDLRILRMAQYLEDMFEEYETMLRDCLPDMEVRAALESIFREGQGHALLRQEIERLTEEAEQGHAKMSSDDLLQAIYECEVIARDFYVTQLDHLSDGRLIDLFKKLAAEEQVHAHAVANAMDALKSLGRRGRHASGGEDHRPPSDGLKP